MPTGVEQRTARIGIVGAGIGGLAAALAIAKARARLGRDDEIVVYEKATETGEHGRGAALLLWSNAVAALAALGLDDRIEAEAAELSVTEVRNLRGDLLSTLPIGAWSRSHGAPTVVIRRPALLDILRGGIPDDRVAVRTGKALRSYEAPDPTGRIRLRFEDGSSDEVDALIGADGFRSVVREHLLGVEPSRSGYDAWVGITPERPADIHAGVATATIGNGPRFWTAALRDGSVFWYATLPRRGAPVKDRQALREVYRGWPSPIEQLIDSTPDGDLIRTQIRDRAPASDWGTGAVTLLGDAAHPSTPDLGQGACQALESAVVIGECIERSARIEDAFRAYERRRMPRTAAISRLCWMTSVNSTVEGAFTCSLRDAAIRVALEPAARSSLAWILAGHGHAS